MSIPITPGSGQYSVAAEASGGLQYQQIEIMGPGGSNTAAVNADGTLSVRISGSVATAGGSFTGSVSGTVGASIIGTVPVTQGTTPWVISSVYGNVSGSVVAFQGAGWSGSVAAVQSGARTTSIVGGASVFQAGAWTTSVVQATNPWTVVSSLAGGIFPVSGSVAAVVTNTNLNVGGSVAAWINSSNASVISYIPNSVATVIVGGSIAASFTPPANQSVSGTVQTDVRNSVATVIIGGSIATAVTPFNSSVQVLNFPTTQNVSGSVVAFQGTNPFIITGSVQGSFSPAANQSVSGTVQTDVRGSVATVIIGGSIAASFTPPANQSVSGTVTVNQGTTPWVQTGSVQGTMSVLGTVPVTQSGTWYTSVLIASVVGAIPVTGSLTFQNGSSVIVSSGAVSVIGTYSDSTVASTVQGVPFMFKANVSSSIMQAVSPLFPLPTSVQGTVTIGSIATTGAVIGSVAVLQGTNPWTVVSSLAGGLFPISGSVAAAQIGTWRTSIIGGASVFQTGTWKTSIASNYATGAASIISAIGNLSLGVRNDTLASVLATSDGQYIPWTVGPAGENIIANAPMNKWVQGTADLRTNSGSSVTVIAAQGASIFTYITGVQIANMGSASVLVTLSGATSSIVGYTIAPAGGGSNIVYPNALKTNANGAFTASISGVASVLVSAQGFISKT